MRVAALSVLLWAFAAFLGRPQEQGPAPFEWLDDLDAARARAALEGKPVLAVFRCVP